MPDRKPWKPQLPFRTTLRDLYTHNGRVWIVVHQFYLEDSRGGLRCVSVMLRRGKSLKHYTEDRFLQLFKPNERPESDAP